MAMAMKQNARTTTPDSSSTADASVEVTEDSAPSVSEGSPTSTAKPMGKRIHRRHGRKTIV